jgi:hypothetical protein
MGVLEILNSGVLPNDLNLTYVAFIPKTQSPTSLMEFRPISLCNVLYKIISKVLANCLKKSYTLSYFLLDVCQIGALFDFGKRESLWTHCTVKGY